MMNTDGALASNSRLLHLRERPTSSITTGELVDIHVGHRRHETLGLFDGSVNVDMKRLED